MLIDKREDVDNLAAENWIAGLLWGLFIGMASLLLYHIFITGGNNTAAFILVIVLGFLFLAKRIASDVKKKRFEEMKQFIMSEISGNSYWQDNMKITIDDISHKITVAVSIPNVLETILILGDNNNKDDFSFFMQDVEKTIFIRNQLDCCPLEDGLVVWIKEGLDVNGEIQKTKTKITDYDEKSHLYRGVVSESYTSIDNESSYTFSLDQITDIYDEKRDQIISL